MEQRTQPHFNSEARPGWASCPMSKSWNCRTTLPWPQNLWTWQLSAAQHRWDFLPGAPSFSSSLSIPIEHHKPFRIVSMACLVSDPHLYRWMGVDGESARWHNVPTISTLFVEQSACKWDFCQLRWLEQQWPKKNKNPPFICGRQS